MDSPDKKILYIDVEKKESDIKASPDLNKYIGGVSLGIRLLETHKDLSPVIFAIGPFNGFFPFASKTAVVLKTENRVEDIYLGGSLSSRIKYCDLDAIVIYGRSKEKVFIDIENDKVAFKTEEDDINDVGLPGKRSVFKFDTQSESTTKKLKLDNYFETPEKHLENAFGDKNIVGFCVTGTKTFSPKELEKYTVIYNQLLERSVEVNVPKGFFPSCSGCPMGCEKSKVGETGGNILVHSLVACTFAQNIYNDISTVFSGLNVLGYQYTHEDIENLQSLVQESLNNI